MALSPVSPSLAEEIKFHPGAQISLKAPRILALWHLTSLDAPMVAVTWALAFAWATGSSISPSILLLMACVTWTVYACDRILDTHRASGSGDLAILRERHFFHWRHRRKFIPIAALAGTVTAIAVPFLLPHGALLQDSVIAIAALFYFSCVHFPFCIPPSLSFIGSKEFAVGALFTAGCAAPALSKMRSTHASNLWPALAGFSFFALIAWLNCAAIQSWESGRGSDGIQRRAFLICATGLVLAPSLAFIQTRASAVVYSGTVSALLLLLLDRTRHRFTPLLLRALADLVLLTPAVLLILSRVSK